MAGNDIACCPKGHLDSALAFGGNSWLQGKAKQGKARKKKPDQKSWAGEVLGLWLVVVVKAESR